MSTFLSRLQIAREIPWIMKNYQLGEITTAAALRRKLTDIFRSRKTDNYKVLFFIPAASKQQRECSINYLYQFTLTEQDYSVLRRAVDPLARPLNYIRSLCALTRPLLLYAGD